MKAEDVVMSDEQIMEYTRAPVVLSGHRRLAEASFRAGMKEVVDSVNLMLRLPDITVDNIKILWQAKLKSWGL